ncbi:MAG: hypothetical protein AAF960_27560 [Bacteroidota bacterium]
MKPLTSPPLKVAAKSGGNPKKVHRSLDEKLDNIEQQLRKIIALLGKD